MSISKLSIESISDQFNKKYLCILFSDVWTDWQQNYIYLQILIVNLLLEAWDLARGWPPAGVVVCAHVGGVCVCLFVGLVGTGDLQREEERLWFDFFLHHIY